MRFSVLGTENEAEVWRYKLEGRLKKALKVKHIEYHKESNTWTTCGQIIRGQIQALGDERGFLISQSIVEAKLHNQAKLL
jgi:hypothetical protein